MDGVLVIDKPAGPTSHDVVAVARRALREKRIGHTGTLDPMATGVLPLVIGRATRLSALLTSDEKEYEAGIRLGAATATYDAAERLARGGPVPTPPDLSEAELEKVLARFRGTFPQVPPPFSAKKVAGVPAYELARKEQPPELEPVSVTVFVLDLLGMDAGLVRLRLRTSSGFYVRALAHDIGVALGCGAHLESLRRTSAGAFGLDQAVSLNELVDRTASMVQHLVPLERLAPHLPAVVLTARGARRASHGNPVPWTEVKSGTATESESVAVPDSGPVPVREERPSKIRLFDPAGRLLAVAEAGPDRILRPHLVLV